MTVKIRKLEMNYDSTVYAMRFSANITERMFLKIACASLLGANLNEPRSFVANRAQAQCIMERTYKELLL